jgi:putative PIN family toxin of toxin-antitoxin system
MPSVVFDTVVFMRALLNPRNRAGRLVFERSDEYTLVLSPPIIQEILEVLQRPEITRKVRSLAGIDMRHVIDMLAEAEIVEFDEAPSISRDPKDDKSLVTAHLGNAEFLVSEDRDLLDLTVYQGVRIVDTAQFLAILTDGEEA